MSPLFALLVLIPEAAVGAGADPGAESAAAAGGLAPVWLFFARRGLLEARAAPALAVTMVFVLRGERDTLGAALMGVVEAEAGPSKVTLGLR